MFICEFCCSIGIFLNFAHLICRSTDILKCFRGSLRLRDNESRLYIVTSPSRILRNSKSQSIQDEERKRNSSLTIKEKLQQNL